HEPEELRWLEPLIVRPVNPDITEIGLCRWSDLESESVEVEVALAADVASNAADGAVAGLQRHGDEAARVQAVAGTIHRAEADRALGGQIVPVDDDLPAADHRAFVAAERFGFVVLEGRRAADGEDQGQKEDAL